MQTYSVEYILTKINESRKLQIGWIEIDSIQVSIKGSKIKTFERKGCNCIKCNAKGLYFYLEKVNVDDVDHHILQLISINKKGKELMMTKDHIKPRSKGGGDGIYNLQPMCIDCNNLKGNSYVRAILPNRVLHIIDNNIKFYRKIRRILKRIF